jgi:hypothetical protein
MGSLSWIILGESNVIKRTCIGEAGQGQRRCGDRAEGGVMPGKGHKPRNTGSL